MEKKTLKEITNDAVKKINKLDKCIELLEQIGIKVYVKFDTEKYCKKLITEV